MSAPEGFNRLKPCRHGQMLYNIHDKYVGRSLDLYGEFSEGEIDAFRQIVRGGDVVIDVGANIGAHTVFFAAATGPTGAVLAFEPQPLVFQLLCANIALNSFSNVLCRNQAVADTAGSIIVPILDPNRETNFGGLALGKHQQGVEVEIIALDDLAMPACRLIKVDVEGMERRVLEGARETIERLKPALYVENDRLDRADELIRFIDSLGYDMYWHQPPLFNPDNFFKNAENVFGNIVSNNMLCFPRGVQVEGMPRVEVPA